MVESCRTMGEMGLLHRLPFLQELRVSLVEVLVLVKQLMVDLVHLVEVDHIRMEETLLVILLDLVVILAVLVLPHQFIPLVAVVVPVVLEPMELVPILLLVVLVFNYLQHSAILLI